MLLPAFVPPPGGAPRRPGPEPRSGSPAGFVIAVVLVLVGMLLPWLRSHADRSGTDGPRDAPMAQSDTSGRPPAD